MGARSPEELETLLEDAFVLHQPEDIGPLFEPGAVLVADNARREARGRAEIERVAEDLFATACEYVADPRRVVQVGDIAVVQGRRATTVMRRGADRCWRYVVACLNDA
jgi:SnoaL-like protein